MSLSYAQSEYALTLIKFLISFTASYFFFVALFDILMRFLGSEHSCVSWLAWAASEGWLKIEILVLRVTQLSSNGDAAVVPLNGVIFYKRLIYQLR